MSKEKVTLTLDAAALSALRELVGRRSLSATVNVAIEQYLERQRSLASVDQWLAELEREHGPVPSETLDWAATLIDDWASRSERKAG